MDAASSIAAPKESVSPLTLPPFKNAPALPFVTITKHKATVIKNNAVIATILIFSRRFKPTRTHTSSNTPMMAHHTPAPAEKIPFAAKAPS